MFGSAALRASMEIVNGLSRSQTTPFNQGLRSSLGLSSSQESAGQNLSIPTSASQPFTFSWNMAATPAPAPVAHPFVFPVISPFNSFNFSTGTFLEELRHYSEEPELAPVQETAIAVPVSSFFNSIQEYASSKNLREQWNTMEEASKRFVNKHTVLSTGDRYGNVKAYPENQVDMTNGSWISLSRVDPLICTCAPPPHAFSDFWESVYDNNVSGIIMLTKLKEGDRVKADRYWPEIPGNKVAYGKVEVHYATEIVLCPSLIKRTFFVKRAEEVSRVVVQLHFIGWPDHGAPSSNDFFHLIDEMEKLPQGKLLVHCSAGIGRTGTLVAFLQAHREMKATIFDTIANGTEPQIDLVNTIISLREQRRGMVQTYEQMSFCFRAILKKYMLLLQEHRTLINACSHHETLVNLLATLEGLNLFKKADFS